jgi:hypothetical protein
MSQSTRCLQDWFQNTRIHRNIGYKAELMPTTIRADLPLLGTTDGTPEGSLKSVEIGKGILGNHSWQRVERIYQHSPLEGTALGDAEGKKEGNALAVLEGTKEGGSIGDTEGTALGDLYGLKEGDSLGDTEGTALGD